MLGVTLGILYVDTQVYVPVLLKNLSGMSCSGAWWWLVSVKVWRLLDGLLLLNVPCSQEFSGVLRFWA